MNKMFAFILALFLPLQACNSWSAKEKLSDYSLAELSFTAIVTDNDSETRYEYEGEITDADVKSALWEIITEQQAQPEIKDGNRFSGIPCLIIHGKNGEDFTVSYTWDREECIVDDYGEPGTTPVGNAFVITGTRSGKYEITSPEAKAEYERLITDYLKENTVPKESVLNKTAKTDQIVFVLRHTNYAWGKTDSGVFLDCWGNLYSFDFSDRGLMSDEEFVDALWEVYCDTNPVRRELCDSDKLFEIMEDISAIDKDAGFTEKSRGYDMGQTTLYAVNYDMELITLRTRGDWDRDLKDKTAKKLCGFLDKLFI